MLFEDIEVSYKSELFVVSFEAEITSHIDEPACIHKALEDCYPAEFELLYEIDADTIEGIGDDEIMTFMSYLEDSIYEQHDSYLSEQLEENLKESY